MSEICLSRAEIRRLAAENRRNLTPPPIANEEPDAEADPMKALPVYGFFLNRSKPVDDVFRYLAEFRLDMGRDPVAFLDRYEDLRIRSFTETVDGMPETRNLLLDNKAYNGTRQYVLVGTRHKGIPELEYDEVIGALPVDRSFFAKSAHLYRFLRREFGGGDGSFEAPVAKSALLNLVRLQQADTGRPLSPPRLAKEPGADYALSDLKARYGRLYPYLFSRVYAVTDTRNGRFPAHLVGRSVIFYAKYPRRDTTVDELLAHGSQNPELGYLPLNEAAGAYDVDSLLALLRETAGDSAYADGRLLVSDNILDRLFRALYHDPLVDTGAFNADFAPFLNQELGSGRHGETVIKASRVNREAFLAQLEAMAARPEVKSALNRAMQNPKYFPHGVYISPTLVRGDVLKQDSVAAVYQTPQNEEALYSRLRVTGLAPHAVSAAGFEFDLAPDETVREQQLQRLFTPEGPAPTGSLNPALDGANQLFGTVDITPAVIADSEGQEVDASISHVTGFFTQDYGIFASDLSEFVRNELSPILFEDNSTNFTARLQAYFDQNTIC